MSSRIRIKMGSVEVEFEGSEEFLKADLMDIISAVATLHGADSQPDDEVEGSPPVQQSTGGGHNLADAGTTSSIAARIRGETGPELAIAAAAHLTFVQNKDTFKRRELLSEMQTAKSYYKQSYSSNLSKILIGLVKDGKFREPAKDTFALSASTRSGVQRQLSE